MSHVWPAAVALLAVALLTPAGAQDQPEVPKPRLAVGGKSAIFYLPLSITERLGYFRDAGLEVEIADVQSGARALQSLVGSSTHFMAAYMLVRSGLKADDASFVGTGVHRQRSRRHAGRRSTPSSAPIR